MVLDRLYESMSHESPSLTTHDGLLDRSIIRYSAVLVVHDCTYVPYLPN